MKTVVISGSSKLPEAIAYWRGYFEGRGYQVLDYPYPLPPDQPAALAEAYERFYRHLDTTDTLFLMNEDKNGIKGYIGASAIAELTYAIIANLNHNRSIDIIILQEPSPDQSCYEEVKFWLDQGWIHLIGRPPMSKPALTPPPAPTPAPLPPKPSAPSVLSAAASALQAFHKSEDTINILTCHKRCLRHLSPARRAYLHLLCPDFPAWLLKYLAAPEIQRLDHVSMVSLDYTHLYELQDYNSVFTHSLGVALIIWHFTHDRKQTLAGLFHDIASPSFKHAIDFLNGDSEHQESIEGRTSEIIRNSRVIMRQLRRDHILAGEVSDYHLYPIADNSVPGLAADRLEYTLSNALFLFNAWDFDQVSRFYRHLTILKNEQGLDELGFNDLAVAQEFTETSLPLFAIYCSDKSRATLQFLADILRTMIHKDLLTLDDLYQMSEREVIDWVLSCGDPSISEPFRKFQRATSVFSSNTPKKDRYCTNVKTKIRYIVPLVQTSGTNHSTGTDTADASNSSPTADTPDAPAAERITAINPAVARAIDHYLTAKTSKYTGFDFEFTPYAGAL